MGFRIRKSIKLMPGVRMTFSKSGVSYSVGGTGFRLTKTARGPVTRTVGIPGAGIWHTAQVIPAARARRSTRRTTKPAPAPVVPRRPGLFAPRGEKALYRAIGAQDWAGVERVMQSHPDHWLIAAGLTAFHKLQIGEEGTARELLTTVFASGQDPGEHPFARKYLFTEFTLRTAPGVEVVLPIGRDAVGLALAETLQATGGLEAAIDVVEQLEPTTYTAVSLAELYIQTDRFDEVVKLTDGITNEDDATALLCVFRGIAFREQGYHDAAREAFKEALRSRSRDSVIRHRALLERAKSYLASGRKAQARTDLERIMAEDSTYEGLRELLAEVTKG